MRNEKKRIAALLMVGMMIFTLPLHALAVGSSDADILCGHHVEHTADCGYTEGVEGTPCTHNHTADCFHPTTSCTHEHRPECYPEDTVSGNADAPTEVSKPKPTACEHQCSKDTDCITDQLDCQHQHDETCGYTEGVSGTPCTFVCEACNSEGRSDVEEKTEYAIATFATLSDDVRNQSVLVGTQIDTLNLPATLKASGHIAGVQDTDNMPLVIEGVSWEPDHPYMGDTEQGSYRFTAKLPEDYSLLDGVQLPVIEVSVALHISATDSKPIIFTDGVHYIENPGALNELITLYCMNNKLHWPHYTPELGGITVPEYTEGYLTEKDFESPVKYEEFLRRVSNLLYAGYPHNGAHLYEIVPDESMRTPTAEEFNKMLIPPPQLADDFQKLKHYKFTYPATQEQIDVLTDFVRTVTTMPENGETSSGLPKRTILRMPFYKASYCLITESEQTPLEIFSIFYGSSYFLTEKQAYDATQLALWKLLNDYGVADNDIDNLNGNDAATLFTEFSEFGEILTRQPKLSELKLEGEMRFSYHSKDGLWHSEPLKLVEPEHYNGLYELTLPDGVTTLHNLTHVYGNEEYELVSDHEVGVDEVFAIKANIPWLKDFKQYSPSPDIEVNGKKFQHMAGSVIEQAALYAQFQHSVEEEGSLSVSKNLVGEDTGESFVFQLWLPDNWISGVYGDMEFSDGFAQFELRHGETKTATHLPAGAKYYLAEVTNGEYHIESENIAGTISKNQTIAAVFTNIPLPDLSIGKVVTGDQGDRNKLFTFTIALKDKDGKPVSGFFEYVGTVIKSGYTDNVAMPADGELRFVDGNAQVQLSHGQQITITSLPYQSTYTVTEQEANEDGYITVYNGNADPETGILEGSKAVVVENRKNSLPAPDPGTPENPDTNPPDKPETPPSDKPETPPSDKPETPTPDKPETPSPDKPETPIPDEPDTPKKGQPDPNIPQPGDHTGINFWMAAVCISFIGFFTVLVRVKREDHGENG